MRRRLAAVIVAWATILGPWPGTPAHAQSLKPAQFAPSRPMATSLIALPGRTPDYEIVEGSREALVRDALLLDFAGYHHAAADVMRVLRARYPNDPLAALIEVEHRFWPQLYDVGPTSRDDPALVEAIKHALDLARLNYEAHPDSLEARALYGRAMMHDARRLAMDGYLMKAGSRSEEARGMLESVVGEAPGDDDARYLLGNYYYWAGVMPAFLKYINWLWFVPQGDKSAGVEMLREVSTGPSVYAESAQVMLSVIGSHHAPTNFEDAVARLRPLHRRYPNNVLIEHELVDVLFKMGRYDEMHALLDDMARRANEPQPFRAYGLVTGMWRARIAVHQQRLDEAEQQLAALEDEAEDLPNWAHAWIDVLNGQIMDLRGRRKEAVAFYKKALDREGVYHSQRADRMAKQGLEAPFDPEGFRHPLLLTGE